MMKLKKLLKDLPEIEVKGSKEIEITGICSNSKGVAPGNLFIARKGNLVDGCRFIPEALSAGAAAILTDLYDPTLKITQLIHRDVASLESQLAAQFHGFPSQSLFMVGVTGTNGKTTTSYLVKHLLDCCFGPCGLIGTIEYLIKDHSYRATHTTPDAPTNQKLLREMVNNDCKAAVMEVTSHALEQRRVDYIDYDAAIFTNLTVDHLDYHQTMERYAAAKAKLFQSLDQNRKKKPFPSIAVMNIDDPFYGLVSGGFSGKLITYGIEKEADLRATSLVFSPNGTRFILNYLGKGYAVEIPLVGRYNVYNCLAAIASVLNCGCSLEQIIAAVGAFHAVPARLESIQNPLGLKIYVDFAHSPDALKNVLNCLQEFKGGRIITVFGCGGDRDKSKRPLMARACAEGSDYSIVTSDNPRSEDPQTIIEDVVKGFSVEDCYACEPDRRKAIHMAIAMAEPQDIVLIAGKGHETSQIFSHCTVPFDDRLIAREACENLALK